MLALELVVRSCGRRVKLRLAIFFGVLYKVLSRGKVRADREYQYDFVRAVYVQTVFVVCNRAARIYSFQISERLNPVRYVRIIMYRAVPFKIIGARDNRTGSAVDLLGLEVYVKRNRTRVVDRIFHYEDLSGIAQKSFSRIARSVHIIVYRRYGGPQIERSLIVLYLVARYFVVKSQFSKRSVRSEHTVRFAAPHA